MGHTLSADRDLGRLLLDRFRYLQLAEYAKE